MQACSETVYKLGYAMAKSNLLLSVATKHLRAKARTLLVGAEAAVVRSDVGLYKAHTTTTAALLASEDPEWRQRLLPAGAQLSVLFSTA